MWEYGAYALYLALYSKMQDVDSCLSILKKLFACAKKPWIVNNSPLYRHITPASQEHNNTLYTQMHSMMLNELKQDNSMAFFRESEAGAAFIKEMDKK